MTLTAVQDNCIFTKSNHSKSNLPVLAKGRCNKNEFLAQLSYDDMIQSDIDCTIKVKSFNKLGKQLPISFKNF